MERGELSDHKHTKGPWQFAPSMEGAGFYVVLNQQGNIVAMRVMGEANARFLATAPDFLTVAELGKVMRAAQRAYFKNRTQENLIASKVAEKAFDDALKTALAKVEP